MARLLSILILSLVAACATTPPVAQTAAPAPVAITGEAELRAVVWNIRVGLGPDSPPASNDPRPNLDAIAAWINRQSPDFVLLQEVDRASRRSSNVDQLAHLEAATGMTAAWAPTIETPTMVFGIGVLSRWPIVEARAIALPVIDYRTTHPTLPDYYSEPRAALLVRVDHPAAPLTVINTHLGLTREQRLAQVTELARLAAAEEAAGRLVLLGGDLNAEPDGAELAPLRALLRDSYQEYTNRHGIVADMPISARNTFPARTPDRCIDYLFMSRRHLMVDAAAVPDVVLSDHRPVLATMHVGP